MTKNNRTLHLVLKRKWWDMIASGEKKEEYRDITSHWASRLLLSGDWIYAKQQYVGLDEGDLLRMVTKYAGKSQLRWGQYAHVTFHLGYTKTTTTFEIEEISIGKGREEWGAEPDNLYFVIKLGARL